MLAPVPCRQRCLLPEPLSYSGLNIHKEISFLVQKSSPGPVRSMSLPVVVLQSGRGGVLWGVGSQPAATSWPAGSPLAGPAAALLLPSSGTYSLKYHSLLKTETLLNSVKAERELLVSNMCVGGPDHGTSGVEVRT